MMRALVLITAISATTAGASAQPATLGSPRIVPGDGRDPPRVLLAGKTGDLQAVLKTCVNYVDGYSPASTTFGIPVEADALIRASGNLEIERTQAAEKISISHARVMGAPKALCSIYFGSHQARLAKQSDQWLLDAGFALVSKGEYAACYKHGVTGTLAGTSFDSVRLQGDEKGPTRAPIEPSYQISNFCPGM